MFPIEKFRNIKTPFYYYNPALLTETLDCINREIASDDQVYHVHYAVKANSNPAILKMIAAAGLGADCVSGGEIQAALDAGFPSHKIVYAGVGKSDWEIELGLNSDIACFNVESLPELHVINQLASQMGCIARVAFRINPNVDAHTHVNITTGLAENKFGIAMEDMVTAIQTANELPAIEYIGLHFHIGSQILDLACYQALCDRINELQDKLDTLGIHTKSINVGGGLGIDYQNPDKNPIPDFKTYFAIFRNGLKVRCGQQVHFELGRSVVAQCGSLISKVLYVKQTQTKRFLILDAGFTDLIRPALYDAYHAIENLSANTAPESCEVYDVVGPICESSDVFAKSVCLPVSKRGDLIALRSAGAYGEVMASTYNCRSLPQAYIGDMEV
jgi:diaminopimelate decarboxylase